MANEIEIMNRDTMRLNITINGTNGDLRDPVNINASDADLRQIATEAVANGSVPGIPALPHANFTNFVVERFPANNERGAVTYIRPKTEFGQ